MSKSEANREWYETAYAELVANDEVRQAARIEAARLAAGSDVTPHASDLEAARRYLKTCVLGMTPLELQSLTAQEAGALWARGAVGAARYRCDKGNGLRSRRGRLRRRGRGPGDAASED